MRHLGWLVPLLAGCSWPEYWLDPRNPCRLDSKIDVVVETPAQMAPNSRAVLRVLVTESRGGSALPASGLPVKVVIEDSKGKGTEVFAGKTADGACAAGFVVPDLAEGTYTIRVETRDYVLRNPVRLKRDYRILLTSDKPLYQPGQVMRLRALALSSLTLKPVEKQALTFEVEDAKGNKVFKRKTETSEFGVAAADFRLADEVIMGDYKVSAIIGDVTSSRSVGVKRYVLPKFRVTIETDRPFYLPGEKVNGTIRAEYFFGKPVAGEVIVKLLAMDAEVREVAKATGKLDSNGVCAFEIPLDRYFVGLPVNKGMANVLLAAQVTDSAEHAEKAARPVPVAKEALQISAVPESGRLVPAVENRIYVATYTPDGQPAKSDVEVEIGGWKASAKTDDGGIAVVVFPAPPAQEEDPYRHYRPRPDPLHTVITAKDAAGRSSTVRMSLTRGEAPGGLLVRPDRALYTSGGAMNVEIVSTVRRGAAFLDLVRDGQTLLTMSIPLADGHGQYAFDIPGDVFGGVEVRAYCVMPNGDILRDSRLVYIHAAGDLKIDVVPSKDVYEPGEDAKIRLHVTDEKGDVRSAVGVAIVDEAVFALQEMRPGLEKVYFTIQEELLEPKYGIKTLPETIERRLDAVALMVLASAETQPSTGGEVAVRNVVNTLEQRQRVMKPRLDRWHRAFHELILDKKVAFCEDGKWAPGFFHRVKNSSHVLERDLWDAWGNRTTIEILERLDPRFTLAYWMERRKP
ncbi:MAG: hypothetical protein HYY17_02950 [Planctomycetes bacterium]|nr:hypothetical protein [Planctomycetota bacterium]